MNFHTRQTNKLPLTVTPRKGIQRKILPADIHRPAVSRFDLAILDRVAQRYEGEVLVDDVHFHILRVPRIEGEQARFDVLRVQFFITDRAIRINDHDIVCFNASHGDAVALFDDAWPVILYPC